MIEDATNCTPLPCGHPSCMKDKDGIHWCGRHPDGVYVGRHLVTHDPLEDLPEKESKD